MTLKQLKQPPLLNPVGVGGEWMLLTPEDEDLARNLLQSVRRGRDTFNNGEYVARVHHCLKWIGVKETITEEDRHDISEYIRSCPSGSHSLDIRFYAKDLGLVEFLGSNWAQEARNSFEQMVHQARTEKPDDEPAGRMVARAYYYAHGLGLNIPPSPTDWKDFKEALEDFRRAENGIGVAQMHCYLGGYGGLGSVTKIDKDLMEKYLTTKRREKDGWGVSAMLCLLNRIQHGKGEEKEQKMPPLKRFGGGG